MKPQPLFWLLALVSLSGGCQWVHYSTQNLIESPIKVLDDCHSQHRFAALARQAWLHFLGSNPTQGFSPDFACGFLAGYVDYLDAGGNGEPPAAPPDRYQHSKYETPEGQNAILDWFAGFRQGASLARASGQRELVVLPISQPPQSSDNVASAQATRPIAQEPSSSPPTPPSRPNPPRTDLTPPVEDAPAPKILPNPTPQFLPPTPNPPRAGLPLFMKDEPRPQILPNPMPQLLPPIPPTTVRIGFEGMDR